MKKITLFLIIFLFPLSVEAKFNLQNVREKTRENLKLQLQNETGATISPSGYVNQIRREIKNEIKERNQGVLDKIKNQIKEKLSSKTKVEGTIEEITSNSLQVKDSQGNSYQIKFSEGTKFVRRFGGVSNINEFKIGNKVVVFGQYTDEAKMIIEARLIRNLSIQKRWGVFFGEVVSKADLSFVIKTISRGELTVYISASTKLLSHDKKEINFSDLKIGDRVRVKGVWDKDLKEIREVDEIRVFPKQ